METQSKSIANLRGLREEGVGVQVELEARGGVAVPVDDHGPEIDPARHLPHRPRTVHRVHLPQAVQFER